MKCLKCECSELCDEGDSFYRCPECNRRFRLHGGRELVERWLGPISLVLYSVIFTRSPQLRASEIAEGLYQSALPNGKGMFRKFTWAQLQYLVDEIESEISNPTQKVKDILKCAGSESDLREYLRLVAKELKDKINSNSTIQHG
jgi:hypothetical protein